MKKKRLRKHKHQGMIRRRISGKKPMSAAQKKDLKKLREESKARTEAFNAKQKAEKKK